VPTTPNSTWTGSEAGSDASIDDIADLSALLLKWVPSVVPGMADETPVAVEFHRDLLGTAPVLREPNLDHVTHLLFDTGDGRILTVFVSDDRDSQEGPKQPDIGAVHPLAFDVDPERFVETREALGAAGRRVSGFGRGAFHSLYARDHDGLVIELATDTYEIPDDRYAEVLARAHEERIAAGAEYADDEHLEAVLQALGLHVERTELPSIHGGRHRLTDGIRPLYYPGGSAAHKCRSEP